MNIDLNPTLKPLVQELKKINIKYYLASTEFARLCNELNFQDTWDTYIKTSEKKRNFIAAGFNHEAYDSENALMLFLNDGYNGDKLPWRYLLISILSRFMDWKKEIFDIDSILIDLKQLNFDDKILFSLKEKSETHTVKMLEEEKVDKNSNIQNIKYTSIEIQKKNWITLISKAKYDKVIDEIRNIAIENKNEWLEIIVNISSRWHILKDQINKNLLEQDKINIETNKINKSLLDFVRNIKH